MTHPWFKTRGYRHFDAPVGATYAGKACDPAFVAKHSWLPLIHYVKRTKRYKSGDAKTVYKDRSIMYASHRDACILSRYAHDLTERLDQHYQLKGLDRHVIAYRKLGRANYHFAADAYRFAKSKNQCVVLCFDVTGFFDNLDHGLLKSQLKGVLGVQELPRDWYAVFRHVTKYRKVERDALKAHDCFGARLEGRSREPIATIKEVIAAGIPIVANPNRYGIPQGTPISSALSNLYMLAVDEEMARECETVGALYRRYSDDILIIFAPEHEAQLASALKKAMANHKLEIKDEKTERAVFGPDTDALFQYLGFNITRGSATIRPSSLARQWRKAKRSIKRTKQLGAKAIAAGHASKVYTKRLRRRFQPIGTRNFSSYARNAADEFGSKAIRRQVVKLERMVDRAIRDLNA
ncbi:MAG: group II intron reverse transcriptase domain-containing protein [Rhizobiaceae bacterium]|nr:group II intron reverse transcriptase domain-containing protein [Rhizobiaceae bacterium]